MSSIATADPGTVSIEALLVYKIFFLNKRKIIVFNIKILKNELFCKNQLYSTHLLVFS